jgi:hypothetical protein
MSAPAPEKPLCFVIGPIGQGGSAIRKHADFLLLGLIKPVLVADEFGYIVKRADEDADPGMITDRLISDIINAELVIADLTGLNPNVFYELGIRHAALKPVIHIAGADTPLPFDNAAHRANLVDVSDWHSVEQARSRLADSVRAIRAPGYQVSNPITQANRSFKMRESSDPTDQLVAELLERVSSLEARNAASERASSSGSGILNQLYDDQVAASLTTRFMPEPKALIVSLQQWNEERENREIARRLEEARLEGARLEEARLDRLEQERRLERARLRQEREARSSSKTAEEAPSPAPDKDS